MSINLIKLEELYNTIINDCYAFFLEQSNKKVGNSIKESFEREQKEINYKLNKLKLCISDAKINGAKYSVITYFSSIYIYYICEFFEKKEINSNLELKYYDELCLSYIALVGFRSFFINNINDNKLFNFQIEEYKRFSEFLAKYSILYEMKKYYEEFSIPIQKEFKDKENLYINLIGKFDPEELFYPQLIKEINSNNNEIENNECNNSTNNKIKEYVESPNGGDLNTTKDSEKKKMRILKIKIQKIIIHILIIIFWKLKAIHQRTII